MSTGEQHRPGWYPDPFGRHEVRWFDGSEWTAHVASDGQAYADPPTGGGGTDGGSLLTERVLVVNQAETSRAGYVILDQHGQQLATVQSVGKPGLRKKALAFLLTNNAVEQTFQIADMQGQVLLMLFKPAAMLHSRMVVQDPDGREIGQIAVQVRPGRTRFDLLSQGQRWGTMYCENFVFTHFDFSIRDHMENEIGRITKTWAGLVNELVTTVDNYVIQIYRPLDDPLRSLVVASAVTVDVICHEGFV